MGKGRILTAHGEGRYTIEITEDRARADAHRALAVQRVEAVNARLTDFEADLVAAQAEVDAAADAQDEAIAEYQVSLDDDEIDSFDARKAMVSSGEVVIRAAEKRDAIAANIRALKAQRISLQRRIDLIDALPPLRQQEAWCADYTSALSGNVATAEVPGEIGQVLIKPGYDDGASWSPIEDGAIQPALSGTPAGVFYNLAIMPGWQKWRPTFRLATINSLSNDLCDITLDAASSSQQGLNVNESSSYANVPIYYMECNGGAFSVGDRVLVAFSGNTGNPMVVGFESNPQLCASSGVLNVSTILRSMYDDPFGEGVHVEHLSQTAHYKRHTEVGLYTCEEDNKEYMRVDVFRQSTVVDVPDRNYVLNDIDPPYPTQVEGASSGAELINVAKGITCTDLSFPITHISGTSFSASSDGWIGRRQEFEGAAYEYDAKCAAGVSDAHNLVISYQYDRHIGGEIGDSITRVSWKRTTRSSYDGVNSFSIHYYSTPGQVMMDPYPKHVENFPREQTSSTLENSIELGGVTVNLNAISDWVATRGGLIYWLPDVAFFRKNGVTQAGMSFIDSRLDIRLLIHVVGFEFNGTTWSRMEPDQSFLDDFRRGSNRRSLMNTHTPYQFGIFETFYAAVPADVG